MRVLLTFAGARDPHNAALVEGTVSDGPVLSVLAERTFERVFVFADERFTENARNLVRVVTERHPKTAAEVVAVPIADPTDYEAIFLAVNRAGQKILRRLPPDRHQYFIATASGTPQMQ